MWNNKINKILIFALSVGVLAGCSKNLNLNPTDTFSESNAFTTMSDIQSGVNAAYSDLGTYINDMYANALLSDEAKLGADNAGQGALTYRMQFTSDANLSSDVTDAWGGYYATIDQVNRVLPKVATVTATAAQEPLRSVYKGQLYALRAVSHFELLQAYCKRYSSSESLGIPLMTTSNVLGTPARNTVAEVTAQIDADFDSAAVLTSSIFTDTAFNKVSVDAYRARYALYKGDWANAVTYATNVINANNKPLVSGTAFSGIWTDANTNELLLRIPYGTSTSVGGLWTTTGGLIYIAPSDKLVSSYTTADTRLAAYIGTNSSGNKYVNKFYSSSRGGRAVDMKVIRTSEMYLIRAEAYTKLSTPNLTAAAADLNALRANRITGYVTQTFSDVASLQTEIYTERYKELCFEGFRYFDLKRNSLPLSRNSTDANAAWQTLDVSSFRWVLPIPQTEILANPNVVQNTGY